MPKSSNQHIFIRAGLPIILTWLLLPLSFFLPIVDPTVPPYFDLSQGNADLIYWVSESCGKFGAPIVVLLVLAVLLSRNGIDSVRRRKEACIIALSAGLFAGGGATINEHYIKEKLKVPRPNITWLAGENGSGPLGMTVKEFYGLGNKKARREPLANALLQAPKPILLTTSIEAHWIHETGFSFPSGHSFSAMFFATFLLMIGATYLFTKRLWLFYLLLPWAVAVCYSRLILRVHTPTDISVGGLQGIVIGLFVWSIAQVLIHRIR